MSLLVEKKDNVIEDFDVTDKELIKNIKSISKKLPFEELFFLKMSDIAYTRKLLKTDDIMYMGEALPDDKKQNIKNTLQNGEAVRNLIITDKKDYAKKFKKLDKFLGKETSSNGSRKNSTPNSNSNSSPNSTETPPLTRETLNKMMQQGGTFGQYRIDFDDSSMTIANAAVREFVRNYRYTDFLLTNTLLISDINLASYMIYGDIMRRSNDHSKASIIVFLFRVGIAFRIAFINVLVVGFLYLTYRNRSNMVPMDRLLKSVNLLIFNGLTIRPSTPPLDPSSGLGIVFTTIYRVINFIIPVKVVASSVVGLFVIFGDTIRTALQPEEVTQDGIPVAQPVPNNILVSIILNGARSGVALRRGVVGSSQALIGLVRLVNSNQRTRSASERPYSAPRMGFTPSRIINTSTGNPYANRPLMSQRQSVSDFDALKAIGVSPRPYSAPQSNRFESQRRMESRDRAQRIESLRRGIAYREGTATPRDEAAQFYDNFPAWWERQREDLRQSGFRGQKGRNSSTAKRKARRRSSTAERKARRRSSIAERKARRRSIIAERKVRRRSSGTKKRR